MAHQRRYVAVILGVQAIVIALALTTTGLTTVVPWKGIAILLILTTLALVRVRSGPPR